MQVGVCVWGGGKGIKLWGQRGVVRGKTLVWG